jgi:hypothetical protein
MLFMVRSSLLGLAVVLAAAPAARAADVDKLLPTDSEYVIYFNVKQILESDIVKKYALEQMKQALQGNDAQKVLTELGLDPLKDIDRVTIGATGTTPEDTKGLIIVTGKFDPDKLYKAAEAEARKDADKFSMIKDGKDVLFKFQPENGNPVYGTVVDDKTVVLGSDKKMVTTALAAATAGKPAGVSKDVAALVGKMDAKASMWVVAVTKGKLDKVRLPGGPGGNQKIQEQIAGLDNVTVTLRVTGDVSLDVNLGMKDDAAADEMGKTVEETLGQVRGFLPIIAANDDRLKPLVEVAKTLKSEVRSRVVTINAKMSGAAIGNLVNPKD